MKLETSSECLAAIRKIEMNSSNVIGGHKAFFSGRTTELTPAAKRKIEAIERKMEKLADGCDDD